MPTTCITCNINNDTLIDKNHSIYLELSDYYLSFVNTANRFRLINLITGLIQHDDWHHRWYLIIITDLTATTNVSI